MSARTRGKRQPSPAAGRLRRPLICRRPTGHRAGVGTFPGGL